MTRDILGHEHRELSELLLQSILSQATQRAGKPSKKNVTPIGLCDLRLRAILTTTMAYDPDDVLRLYVGTNTEGFQMLRTL